MPRLCLAWACVLAAVLASAPAASAQLFSFSSDPRAVQSLSVGYYLIDFEFDGAETPLFSFDFDEPAYGLVYSRPHLLVTVALGTQRADAAGRESLRLLDFSLTTWGELRLGRSDAGRTRVFVPVVLFSNYRRVSPRDAAANSFIDAFNVTVLGLGAGLGLNHPFGETAFVEVRANPVFGLASSSFTDALGTARLVEADAQLHLARIFGRAGLSLGYSFRWQAWNVNASDLFPDVTEDLFDYKGRQHLFRAGVNW